MNDIVRPITTDGMAGFDSHDQLWVRWRVGDAVHSTIVADVRDLTCALCERGWDPTAQALRDQTFWSLIEAHVHRSCLDRHAGFIDRRMFYDALCDARIRYRGLKALPNGYDGNAQIPWYRAELVEHPACFVLGWRKRVAHIELLPHGVNALPRFAELEAEFAAEDVTKSFHGERVLLHAWSEAKVRDYLARIARVARLGVPT